MKRFAASLLLLLTLAMWAVASTTSLLYTRNQTETCTLAALASGSARQCAMVNNDNATNDVEDQVYVKFKTGASPSAQGTVTVYGYQCFNASTSNCIDAGEITGTDAAVTIPTTGTTLPLMIGNPTCWANVGATNYICAFSVAQTFSGTVPSGWGVVVVNNSGAALDATCTGCGVFYDRVQLKNQ